MLRIDINNVGEENNYVIPSDNPYVNNNEGHREEIYAYGFRNPWRFSFDNFTGNCWIADVGQDEYEEISILELGGNFGWNIMEGFHCFNPSANCDTSGLILPIYEYDHSIGESITGGYVYRGMMLPSLIGKYIFADFEYGHIYALEYNNLNNLDVYPIGDLGPYSVTSFGVDHNNEIYICKLNGEIYKFLDDSVISIDSIDDIEFSMPTHYVLHQNYPNPFNPITTLGYDLQQDGLVNITIYDMLGNAVNTLVNTNQSSGYKSIQWDATNNQTEPVSAGVYLYSIQAGEFRSTKKMVLLK